MSPKKSQVDAERRAEIEREWANGEISSEIMRPHGQPPPPKQAEVQKLPVNNPPPNDQVSWCAG
jgi:hypothetical protein